MRALPNLPLPVARHADEGSDDLDKSPSPAPTEPINYQDDSDDGGQENRHAPPDDGTFAGNKRNRSPEEQSRSPEENRPPLEPVSTLHYIQHRHLLGRGGAPLMMMLLLQGGPSCGRISTPEHSQFIAEQIKKVMNSLPLFTPGTFPQWICHASGFRPCLQG